MFIIEGADCLGKTTAAKRIVELARQRAVSVEDASNNKLRYQHGLFPIRYEHMGRPNEAFNFFTDYRDIVSRCAVQDRFHIGGLVWHDNKISEGKLRMIEGWLACAGSYTLIMYAEDDDWLRKLLIEKGDRDDLFGHEAIIAANKTYREMAVGTYLGPIPKIDSSYAVDQLGWPSDELLSRLLTVWTRRLKCVR